MELSPSTSTPVRLLGIIFSLSLILAVPVARATPKILSQPSNKMVVAASTATFEVKVQAVGNITYQWQISTRTDPTFSDLTEGDHYRGTRSATLTIGAATANMDGSSFRCVVQSDGLAQSSAAGLIVADSVSPTSLNPRKSPNGIKLPDAPTTSDLFAARILPEPLVPTWAEPKPSDTRSLADALITFQARKSNDDFSSLENYLADNPNSPWRLAILTNLGLLQYHAGYYSRCIKSFLAAWRSGKAATEPKAKSLADVAAAEYSKMLARLGRYDDLRTFLDEIQHRNFIGRASELVTASREGATLMQKHPELAFRCGPLALSRILAAQGSPLWSSSALENSKSSTSGISLLAVKKLSTELGMNYQAAKRSPGAAVIVPSVIHWNVGHYAALTKTLNGQYLTEDPTFEDRVWHSQSALESESSGYFLVPPGPLPDGWTAVSDNEANLVYGKGGTSGPNKDPKPNDPMTNPSCSKNTRAVGALAEAPSPTIGMATYSFRIMLASLQITDTPVGYLPPYGSPIQINITYVQRDPNQPSNFNYSNFGPKWGFNWQQYIIDDPNNPAVASQALPGASLVTFNYQGESNGAYVFASQFDTHELLSRPIDGLPYKVVLPDGSQEIFGQSDGSSTAPRRIFLTQIIDSSGNTTSLSYDSLLRLTTITDALGQQTTFSYNTAGDSYKISSIADPFGRSAQFSYDSIGRLIKITDVIGIQSTLTYNGGTDFINSLTTPYGTTTFSEIENGSIRRILATDPLGGTEVVETNYLITPEIPFSEAIAPPLPESPNQYLYYRNSFYWNKKQWKDAPNDYSQAHLYHWLHDFNFAQMSPYLASEKLPLHSRIWYVYPGQNGLGVGTQIEPLLTASVVEGGNQITQTSYNSVGNLTQITDPLNRITTYSYSPDGVDLWSIYQLQAGTNVVLQSNNYDSQHHLLSTTDAAGQTTTCTWNSQGRIASSTNPKGETTTFNYYTSNAPGKQRLGQLRSIVGALAGGGDITSFDYDATGNVASATGPDGYTLSFTYDALNRLTSAIYPDSTSTQILYQALHAIGTRDRLGRLTQYSYNGDRELTSVTDPAGRTTRYQWCTCGELASIVDPMGRTTSWQFDVAGRMTTKSFADSSTVSYSYEPLSGRLSSIVDERLQKKTFTYNLDDTIAGFGFTGAIHTTPGVSYQYDPAFRRLTSMTDGTGTTTYTYNPIPETPTLGAGQLASINRPWSNSSILYGYDALGRVVSRSTSSSQETFNIDAAGRVTAISNALGTFSYTYDGASERPTSVTHNSGATRVFTYFPELQDYRLKQISNLMPDGITPISNFSYTYDVEGKISTWTQQTGASATTLQTWTPQYDQADQMTSLVTSQQGVGTNTYAWSYDLAGNRTSETLNSTSTVSNYNPLNQPINSEANLSTATYEWDAENRLVSIIIGAARSDFSYDGDGHRVSDIERLNGNIVSSTTFLWDRTTLLEQRDSTGTTVQQRFFDQGFQSLTGPALGTNLYTFDHLGSVREVLNNSGALEERINYSPWGTPTSSNTVQLSPFAFGGFWFHATSGLQMARYRPYDSLQGRWLSRDPLQESAGINLYAYVGNNPITYTDRLGLLEGLDDIIVFGGGAVGGIVAQYLSNSVTGCTDGYLGAILGGGLGAWISWNTALLFPELSPQFVLYVNGTVSGFVSSLVNQQVENPGNISGTKLAVETATGFLGAKSVFKIPYDPVTKQIVTKLGNGTINNVSSQTLSKIAGSQALTGIVPGIVDAGAKRGLSNGCACDKK